MSQTEITVTPLGPGIGARIAGIDLSTPLATDHLKFIRQCFTEHLVVTFANQSLSGEQQILFTEHFGKVEPHPLNPRPGLDPEGRVIVLENKPGVPGARNDFWHSDISCMPRPPAMSVLHAINVPAGKGDTQFCNMYQAYERLPQSLKDSLATKQAEHSGEAIRQRNLTSKSDAKTNVVVPPSTKHPIFRKHPVSGKTALFVNRFFTTGIDGLSEPDCDALLEELESVATTKDNVYRHQWQAGDVLMWDNRCAMHYAVYDYEENEPRRMHRTTASGERPVAA